VVIAAYAGAKLRERRKRAAAGLPVPPMQQLVIRLVVIAVVLLATAAVLAADRGLPLALVIFFALVVLVDLLINRTRFGRHVLAVGGNPEAARRAGSGSTTSAWWCSRSPPRWPRPAASWAPRGCSRSTSPRARPTPPSTPSPRP
jgi:ABC-type xylose transport system permease subunit